MAEQRHRCTPEDWRTVEKSDHLVEFSCLLELRDRIEALEAAKSNHPAKPDSSLPPSLKQLALQALDQADKGLSESEWQQRSDIIRRALESLPD